MEEKYIIIRCKISVYNTTNEQTNDFMQQRIQYRTRVTKKMNHLLKGNSNTIKLVAAAAAVGFMAMCSHNPKVSAFPLHSHNHYQQKQSPLYYSTMLFVANDKRTRKGVRSRVKSVLKKASVRTGIRNNSDVRSDVVDDDDTDTFAYRNYDVNNNRRKLARQDELNILVEGASIGADSNAVDDLLNIAEDEGVVNGQELDNVTENTSDESTSEPEGNEDGIEETSTSEMKQNKDVMRKNDVNVDSEIKSALMSDNSAAFDRIPAEPLPFKIPKLTQTQLAAVRAGERVQEQSRMGREGDGFVVIDVEAPEDCVWGCLLDFYSYPDIIPTVRDITMYTNTHLDQDYNAEKKMEYEDGTAAVLKVGVPSVTRASFTLSKFKLKIAAIHKYRPHPKGDYMIFTLDPAMTNFVLKSAKGVWHTQANPDGKEGFTRVWLLCEVKISSLLPQFITDYAASRAMPRATTWLKPQVEAACALWLKQSPNSKNR